MQGYNQEPTDTIEFVPASEEAEKQDLLVRPEIAQIRDKIAALRTMIAQLHTKSEDFTHNRTDYFTWKSLEGAFADASLYFIAVSNHNPNETIQNHLNRTNRMIMKKKEELEALTQDAKSFESELVKFDKIASFFAKLSTLLSNAIGSEELKNLLIESELASPEDSDSFIKDQIPIAFATFSGFAYPKYSEYASQLSNYTTQLDSVKTALVFYEPYSEILQDIVRSNASEQEKIALFFGLSSSSIGVDGDFHSDLSTYYQNNSWLQKLYTQYFGSDQIK